jgi:phospholipase/carboxylesterase
VKRAGADPSRARAGLVLAHGRGASAGDILGLMDHLALPDIAAIAPEAPGNSWWPVSFLAPLAQTGGHVDRGVLALEAAIAALEANGHGIPRHRIWLAGFSQGACLALETFARRGAGLAGVFALSGGLVGTGDTDLAPDPALYGHSAKQFDYSGTRSGKVWISVHAQDPHIPLQRAKDSAAVLRALGAEATLQVYPGQGHAIMRDDITAMRGALNG